MLVKIIQLRNQNYYLLFSGLFPFFTLPYIFLYLKIVFRLSNFQFQYKNIFPLIIKFHQNAHHYVHLIRL